VALGLVTFVVVNGTQIYEPRNITQEQPSVLLIERLISVAQDKIAQLLPSILRPEPFGIQELKERDQVIQVVSDCGWRKATFAGKVFPVLLQHNVPRRVPPVLS